MQQTTISKSPRVEVVDALRGFAVLAILLVHHVEHFIYPVYPDPATLPGWLNVLNEGVFTVVFGLFAGKSYSIFALLFGFTFYIQYSNQQAKGKDFGYRFLWRMLLLTLFATLNAAFYPAGDVLLLYAIVGVVLFIVRKWSDKAVLITAVIFLLQPVEWYHYIASLFNPDYQLDVLRTLMNVSKRKSFMVVWPGTYKDGKLIYAQEGYSDYKSFDLNDYDITVVI